MNNTELSKRLEFIEQTIRSTAHIFKNRLQDDFLLAEEKSGPNDLVTKYDKEVEELITRKIEQRYPGEFILGEESFTENEILKKDQPLMWVIDPIDGTTNFYKNYPFFCSTTSIIINNNGKWAPVLAATWDPTRDEMFSAIKGGGAFLNGQKINCSKNDSFERGLFTTGFASSRGNPSETKSYELFVDITRKTLGVRRDGAAALDLAYVAAGRTDGYWESNLSPWDLAAGALLVDEAGGICSQLNGDAPWDPFSGEIIACNPRLHKRLLNELGSPSL